MGYPQAAGWLISWKIPSVFGGTPISGNPDICICKYGYMNVHGPRHLEVTKHHLVLHIWDNNRKTIQESLRKMVV